MKNKKTLIAVVIIIIVILIVLILSTILHDSNKNYSYIDNKLNILKSLYENDLEVKEINSNNNIVLISISDMQSQAIVKFKNGSSIEVAYSNTANEIKNYIKRKHYDPKWVKLDIVKDVQEILQTDLDHELKNTIEEYTYRKGIIIEDNNIEIVLTEAELNSNLIYDYDKNTIDLNFLNLYLKNNDMPTISTIPNKLKIFTTLSYFCDESNNGYKLYNNGANTGRRLQDANNYNDIKDIVENSSNYLANMVQDDGKFIYGYYPLQCAYIEDYNIVRHAGSLWALILLSNQNKINFKESIDKAYNYLNSQIVKKDDNLYYIIEEKNDEIKLGANALSAIAICEYINKYDAKQDLEIAEKLGNGIIGMQNEDGSYVHVLNSNDFSVKDNFRTVYYDDEATFALVKLYGLTKNEKYLAAAQKSLKYFIDKDYQQYGDHWLLYAINEITNYVDNEEYYELALKTLQENMKKIHYKEYTSHTDFELLMQCYEIYNKILDKNINVNYLNEFSSDKFIELIKEKAEIQLNSFFYPEMAMYTKKPNKFYNSFFIRHSNFRIRIDDIQHSSVGLWYYMKNFCK